MQTTIYVLVILALCWYLREPLTYVLQVIVLSTVYVVGYLLAVPFLAIWAGLRLFGRI